MAGLQVEIVRIAIVCRLTHESGSFSGREPHPQAVVHDGAGDLVLHVQEIGGRTVIGARPELLTRGDVEQAAGNLQSQVAPFQRSGQYRLYSELTSCLDRVSRLPFESENGRERFHPERCERGNLLDEAAGNAVAQIIEVLVGGDVRQRKNGKRLRGGRGTAQETPA